LGSILMERQNLTGMMTNFKFQEVTEGESYDPSSLCKDVSFTQAGFYGDWHISVGRTVKRFLVYRNQEVVAYFLFIKCPLLFGKSYLYIPYGPVIKDFSADFFAALQRELYRLAKRENAVFVRLDFTPPVATSHLSKFFTRVSLHSRYSAFFQPRREWFLNLEKSADELLAAMHEKTRYSIRLAERKGVTAEIVTRDFDRYFDIFYELMSATAERNGFSLHQKSYYKNIFRNLSATNAYLSIAKYEEKILCVYLIVIYGRTAHYLYGGSSTQERNRMPTYSAHWMAIMHAKQFHCKYYNFGGIGEENDLLNKKMTTLTFYKKRFGGFEVTHSDFFDVVVQPLWYRLYNFRKYLKRMNI